MCNFAAAMRYNTHTLGCGLRLIHLAREGVPVVYCGYGIAAGTRDERPGQEGLAHFCEHMTFKGTHRRNALQIINRLEGIGGELNAYTTKEDTTYYAALPRHHFARAVDLLTDIVADSTFPQHELEKEVEVVADEIESYLDSPAELIYDDFENLLFEGHPLGHNILGEADRLRSYRQADLLAFARENYRPDNMVFFVDGDIDFPKLVKRLENLWNAAVSGRSDSQGRISPIQSSPQALLESFPSLPRTITHCRSTHQAHIMIGTRAYRYDHPRRMSLYLLNNILGGPGLNARLNLSLRERRGLVYTVESAMTCYRDTGAWSVYFGCDHDDASRCRRLVGRELDRLCQRPLSQAQLAAAKQQIRGQLAIASDNREQFALDLAKGYLHHGSVRQLETLYEQVDAVTADDILQTARELFAPDRLTTLIYT